MIIVSDTTAITTLLKTSQEWLLRELFGEVIVPKAVWDELRAFHDRLPEFLLERPTASKQRLDGTALLGQGEAEAILLATELRADFLLTDDRKARAAASRLGIKCVGLLAVMVEAKSKGHIPSVKAAIVRLEKVGGLYLSNSVKSEALKLADEY